VKQNENNIRTIGDYETILLIGEGAQGKVWKAKRSGKEDGLAKEDQIVALKILRYGLSQNTSILSTLDHPNIVKYLDSFVWYSSFDDHRCIVMEYIAGNTLDQLIKNNPKGMKISEVKDIFTQSIEALMYAKNKGVIHRDIKPSNIFIRSDGKVKIIDFDIARQEHQSDTTTVGWRGAFDYMSPDFCTEENFRGDIQSDIFSLGVCLYEAITGHLPLPKLGENADIGYSTRWRNEHEHKKIDFNRGGLNILNKFGREIIYKSLQKNRAARCSDYGEFLTAIKYMESLVVAGKEDSYELVSYLGSGGFGKVMVGKSTNDGKNYAIKKLDPPRHDHHKHVKRFEKEATLLKKLTEQMDESDSGKMHIVKYVDFIRHSETGEEDFFLAMELLPGMPEWTLHHRIEKNRQGLPVIEVLELFIHYLEAVQYLHGKDIIHRDIKPANLYAPENDPVKAKLFDLGIVRDLRGTRTMGSVPGTLEYMAPELVNVHRGERRSDIFALGLCLYKALTGKPAFPPLSRDPVKAVDDYRDRISGKHHVDYTIEPFASFPQLAAVVAKAIAMRPEDRYASCESMRHDIEKLIGILENTGMGTDPETRTGPTATGLTAGIKGVESTTVPGTLITRPYNLSLRDKARFAHILRLIEHGDDFSRRSKYLVATAVAIITVVAGLSYKSIKDSLITEDKAINTILTKMAQYNPPLTKKDYVTNVEKTIAETTKWKQKKTKKADVWQTQEDTLRSYLVTLPAVFSNKLNNAVDNDQYETARDLCSEWKALEDKHAVMGLKTESYVTLEKYMSSRCDGLKAVNDLKKAAGSYPVSLCASNLPFAENTLKKLTILAQDDLSRFDAREVRKFNDKWRSTSNLVVQAGKSYMASLRKEILNGYLFGKKDEAMRKESELKKFLTVAPLHVSITEGTYNEALAFINGMSKMASKEEVKKILGQLSVSANDVLNKSDDFKQAIGDIILYQGFCELNEVIKIAWQRARQDSETAIGKLVNGQYRPSERQKFLGLAEGIINSEAGALVLGQNIAMTKNILRTNLSKYRVLIENNSDKSLVVDSNDIKINDLVSQGGSSKYIDIAVDKKTSGGKVTINLSPPQGFKIISKQVVLAMGGGADIIISTSDLQIETIILSISMDKVKNPPALVEYKGNNDSSWTLINANLEKALLPGNYQFRFTRPGYETIARSVELKYGDGRKILSGPNIEDWKLIVVQDKAMEYEKTLKESELQVDEYLKWRYQRKDPWAANFRKGNEPAPAIKLADKQQAPSRIDPEGIARDRRINVWRQYFTAGGKDEDVLVSSLRALSSDANLSTTVAQMCDVDALIMESPGKVPEKYLTAKTPVVVCGWRSHVNFYPDGDNLPSLDDMMTGSLSGYPLNEYDIRLILYAAYTVWMNADVKSVSEKRYIGYSNKFLASSLRDVDDALAKKVVNYFGKKAVEDEGKTSNPAFAILKAVDSLPELRDTSSIKITVRDWLSHNSNIKLNPDFAKVLQLIKQ